MTPEEYFKEWSKDCRLFHNYQGIHSHDDMMKFAKDYHKQQLNIGGVGNRRELLKHYSNFLYENEYLTKDNVLMEYEQSLL
jgi:hypothetical protein